MEIYFSLSFVLNGRTILPPASLPCDFSRLSSALIYALTYRSDPRALIRLQADHVNRSLVPAFYRYLQAQDSDKQTEYGKEFHSSIEVLVNLLHRAEQELLGAEGTDEDDLKAVRKGLGAWLPDGVDLGWLDIMAGPCVFILSHTLVLPRL